MTVLHKHIVLCVMALLVFSGLGYGQEAKEEKEPAAKQAPLQAAPVALQKLGDGVLTWLRAQKQGKINMIDYSKAAFVYDKDSDTIILEIKARDFQVYRLKQDMTAVHGWARELHTERGPDTDGIIVKLKMLSTKRIEYQAILPQVFAKVYWDLYLNVVDIANTGYAVEVRVLRFHLSKKANEGFAAALSKEIGALAKKLTFEDLRGAVK